MAELVAFSIEDVARLTGLSIRRLAYMDRTKFFTPSYADENRRAAYSRVYSFRDVVGLRTIAIMRDEHRVPLQELRMIKPWLERHSDTPWASLSFYVAGRKVFFDDPETGARMAGRPVGQTAIPIAMEPIAKDMKAKVARLRERAPEQIGRVERNRHVVHNSWVVAGTRVSTAAIWEFHQAGYGTAEIIRQYPTLTAEDVRAAIEHEARLRQKKAG